MLGKPRQRHEPPYGPLLDRYVDPVAVLALPATLLVAWVLAVVGVTPPGADPGDEFAQTAMRWMMTMPAGYLVIASGIMHTVFARSTAKNIGWTTNGFQYELGFVSIGLGIAGVIAAYLEGTSWLVLSLVLSVFLLGAAGLHIKEMVRDRNFAWGNTWVLLYDVGLPVSLIALLVAGAA